MMLKDENATKNTWQAIKKYKPGLLLETFQELLK